MPEALQALNNGVPVSWYLVLSAILFALGVAGFPTGNAYKVGSTDPYLRLQRAFIRQTFDLPGVPIRMMLRKGKNPYAEAE